MTDRLYLGIDIGGQSSKCGVVTESGEIIEQLVITSLQPTLEEYIADLTSAINNLKAKSISRGEIVGIGIGAPNANYYTGSIEFDKLCLQLFFCKSFLYFSTFFSILLYD